MNYLAPSIELNDENMQRLLGGAKRGLAFVVRPGPSYDDPSLAHLQWEHARNMFALLRAGKLRAVSALLDGTDVLGMGLLTTDDRAEAEALLREDPGVRGGRLRFDLLTDASFAS